MLIKKDIAGFVEVPSLKYAKLNKDWRKQLFLLNIAKNAFSLLGNNKNYAVKIDYLL